MKDLLNEVYLEEMESREKYNKVIFQEAISDKLKSMFKNKTEKSKKFISTKCYLASKYNYKVGSEEFYGSNITKTKSEAIECHLIKNMNLGTKNGDKLYINKKYEQELDSITFYLYKVKLVGYDDYIWGAYNCKILESEKLTLREALNHVNYEFRDNSAEYNRRKQISTKVISIAKKVLNDIGKDTLNGGFKLVDFSKDYGKEELELFLNCIEDYFSLVHYDAWKFTNNKARDEEEYEKFDNVFMNLMNRIQEELNKNNIKGKLDIYGDWDDGPIVFIIDK
jgi:hypothetical protein